MYAIEIKNKTKELLNYIQAMDLDKIGDVALDIKALAITILRSL